MITAICCGPLTAPGQNVLAVISGNGWVHVLEMDGSSLRQRHSQRIPANVKTALLADVDLDQQLELVVALTDRVVRVYRWTDGTLRAISKCELMQQIGTISLNIEGDGRPSVLVSQPGAAVVRLRYRSSLDEDGHECHSVDIDDVSLAVKTRQNVSCEVLGGLRDQPASNTYALITMDGSLFYVKDNAVEWSVVLHHQLFGLTKMDVTSDGSDELIVSSWDGHTFIINQEKQSVQFLFEEAVTAFAAGQFGARTGSNVPCMVYATVGKVVVYHNVRLPVMVTETLTDVVAHEHGWPGAERLTACQLQQLYRWCLYGFPRPQLEAAECDTPQPPQDDAHPEQSDGAAGGARGGDAQIEEEGWHRAECDAPGRRTNASDAA
ncbi:KICSTOR complex protein ITFG2-like isoform X2 [Pollicipes pollicipes]|nr:KICSTOR complex protein ITFG2-like isoform X2 [Pollicipes pollicipes]XP_037070811.1 KICSTOR complex protein ITFG2-like isoform X2 [Pollicipes pollicipes]XP_037083680.1 KICSTOR complex protein ITFG2-like isoform X2 [Pollicipes pollicipes]